MIESAVFILLLESMPKLGSTQSGLGTYFETWRHSKQSFNSPAAAATRNDRVLNREKLKRNEKLKKLDECATQLTKFLLSLYQL